MPRSDLDDVGAVRQNDDLSDFLSWRDNPREGELPRRASND